MIEKTVVSTLKGFSAVVYVVIMLTLLSIPGLFLYEAIKLPEFTFYSVTEPENLENDEFLLSKEESPEDWKKIDFGMCASSGKFSAYHYNIYEFSVSENEVLKNAEEYHLLLDEPLYFTNTKSDDFVLSLYVKTDEEINIGEFVKTLTFNAKSYEKGFSEFNVKYEEEN